MTTRERQNVVPRVFIFAGKAAPNSPAGKALIKLICVVGKKINGDKDIADTMKV
jgi:starch phosphorylase